MRRTQIALVNSSKNYTIRYVIIKRGNRFECNCLGFYFQEDRDKPCRHITKLLDKVRFDESGEVVEQPKAVELTKKGKDLLLQRHRREAARIQREMTDSAAPA